MKNFKCNFCRRSYKTKEALEKHNSLKHLGLLALAKTKTLEELHIEDAVRDALKESKEELIVNLNYFLQQLVYKGYSREVISDIKDFLEVMFEFDLKPIKLLFEEYEKNSK